MNYGRISCYAMVTVFALMHDVWAVSAAPIIVTLAQPDGSTFEAMPKGDEYASWMETLDGVTVIQDGDEWFYAIQDLAGALVSSGTPVGSLSPADLALWPQGLSAFVDPEIREEHYPMRYRDSSDPSRALTHTQNILVILVNYDDITFTYFDASFQTLIFAASSSVKDFFDDNSYGSFTVSPAAETSGVSNDGVVHITRTGFNHPDLGLGDWKSEASAIVGSPTRSCHFFVGSWLVKIVERLP